MEVKMEKHTTGVLNHYNRQIEYANSQRNEYQLKRYKNAKFDVKKVTKMVLDFPAEIKFCIRVGEKLFPVLRVDNLTVKEFTVEGAYKLLFSKLKFDCKVLLLHANDNRLLSKESVNDGLNLIIGEIFDKSIRKGLCTTLVIVKRSSYEDMVCTVQMNKKSFQTHVSKHVPVQSTNDKVNSLYN